MIIGAYGYWRVRRWQFRNLVLVGAALALLSADTKRGAAYFGRNGGHSIAPKTTSADAASASP